MSSGHVVVVGAGFAGLAASWRLARAGLEVTLLEREARAGGRAAGAAVRGMSFDPCGSLLWTSDAALRSVLAELDLEHVLVPWPPHAWAVIDQGRPRHIRPEGVLGISRMPEVRLRDAWRWLRFDRLLTRYEKLLDPAFPERAAALDDRSLRDFGRLYFGESVLEGWMAPFVANTCLCGYRETSRVLFLLRCVLQREGVPVGLRIGVDGLARAMAERLSVHCGAEAMRIEPAPRGRVRVHLREGAVDTVFEADAAVIATPAYECSRLAAELLAPVERDFLGSVRYTSAITLAAVARANAPLATRRVWIPRRQGWPLDALALEPGAPEGHGPEGCVTAVLVADDGWSHEHIAAPDEAIAKELLGHFARLYPDLRSALLFTRLTRHPRAMPRFDVGRYRALARFRAVQEDLRRQGRRMYPAGDYLVAPSIEGALGSGLRAADAVCEDLGIPMPASALSIVPENVSSVSEGARP